MRPLLDPIAIERLKDSAPADQRSEFVVEVLQLFLDAYLPILKKMQGLIDQKDLPRIRKIAHQLKGLSLQVGAVDLAETCNRIEFQDPVNILDLNADMQRINAIARETDAALRALILEFSSSAR